VAVESDPLPSSHGQRLRCSRSPGATVATSDPATDSQEPNPPASCLTTASRRLRLLGANSPSKKYNHESIRDPQPATEQPRPPCSKLPALQEQEHRRASLRNHCPVGKVGSTPASTIGKISSAPHQPASPHSSVAEVYGHGYDAMIAFWFYTRIRFYAIGASIQRDISTVEVT
jgi:hypothetical protein